MAVMAAGMHLPRHGGFVGQIVRLLDRQRIHVSAQADHLAGPTRPVAPDDADHAGAPDAGHHLVAAERGELSGDRCSGPVHVVEELRMRMNIVPPGGDLALEVRYTIDNRHCNGSLPPTPSPRLDFRAEPSRAARSRRKWARSAQRA